MSAARRLSVPGKPAPGWIIGAPEIAGGSLVASAVIDLKRPIIPRHALAATALTGAANSLEEEVPRGFRTP